MITMLMSVGAGGAFGAITRYLIGAVLVDRFGASSWVGTMSPQLRGFLAIGFLGALTTFSSYALDGYGFWMRDELLSAFLYVSASVILSLGGFMAAYAGMRLVLGGGAWN